MNELNQLAHMVIHRGEQQIQVDPAYEPSGELCEQTFRPLGAPPQDDTWTYWYDFQHRLIQVVALSDVAHQH